MTLKALRDIIPTVKTILSSARIEYRIPIPLVEGSNPSGWAIRELKTTALKGPDKIGTFFVNGVKTYIRGTDRVPLDAFRSRNGERLDKTLDMLVDVNRNAVRCCGMGLDK